MWCYRRLLYTTLFHRIALGTELSQETHKSHHITGCLNNNELCLQTQEISQRLYFGLLLESDQPLRTKAFFNSDNTVIHKEVNLWPWYWANLWGDLVGSQLAASLSRNKKRRSHKKNCTKEKEVISLLNEISNNVVKSTWHWTLL